MHRRLLHLPRNAPVLFLAALLALPVHGNTVFAADQREQPHSVSVQGEAERRVAPDMANVRMDVISEGVDVARARREADAVTAKALEALRAAGIADADIDTTGLSIAPQYRWLKDQRRQQLTGYRVSRSIDVRILDLALLGPVLETLTDTGVNSVSPPQLGLRDTESVHQEVLAAAAANARERAAVLAEALGAELGKVINAQAERQQRAMPMRREMAMGMAADSAEAPGQSYSAGDLTYRAVVYATFELH